MAHNTFAVAVLIPTFGILEWTEKEIEKIGINTRKLLTHCGNFHRNSSVPKLHQKKRRGRGLKCISDIFASRIVSIHELERILRVGEELCTAVIVHLVGTQSKQA